PPSSRPFPYTTLFRSVGADDDVGTRADIGRHRRLGPHVLPALGIDPHLDPGLLGELAGQRVERIDVALDELLPAQHPQLRARLRDRKSTRLNSSHSQI